MVEDDVGLAWFEERAVTDGRSDDDHHGVVASANMLACLQAKPSEP
jgi:hypothetical protein